MIAALGAIAMAAVSIFGAFASEVKLVNDDWLRDADGKVVCRQGGGIFRFGDAWYRYGVDYPAAHEYALSYMIDEGNGWQRRTETLAATNGACEIVFVRTTPCRIDDITLTRKE